MRRHTNIIPTWTGEQVSQFLADNASDTYTLLDVRQPEEYARGHLPGATLIPLGEIARRVEELDPQRPTIVYCHVGGRSASAVSFLVQSGFTNVWNMAGGIQAYPGDVTRP